RLRAEVLTGQHADAREALVLFASDREDVAPLLLGIAECAQSDMDLTRAERPLPVLRIVDALVAELPGARRHPNAERLGKACQRSTRNPERREARVTDRDRQPGVRGAPPVGGGVDIWCEPAQEVAARPGLVDAQEHVRAEVGRRAMPE